MDSCETLQDRDRRSGGSQGGHRSGGRAGEGSCRVWVGGCASILEQARSVLGNVRRAGRSAGQARPYSQCHG